MRSKYPLLLFAILVLLLGGSPATGADPVEAMSGQSDSMQSQPETRLPGVPSQQDPPDDSDGPALSTAQAASADWQFACVECPKQFQLTTESLQLDGDGHPHIAYGGDHLYYAWSNGTDWHYETVDGTLKVGASASLILDGAGNPHISYYDERNGVFKYAHRQNEDWTIRTVGSAVDGSSSLAVDAAGRPHIVYSSNDEDPSPTGLTAYAVTYAFWTGSDWDIQVLEQGTAVSNYLVAGVSLALDTAGHPHISYALNYLPSPCGHCIKYARWTGSAWDIALVEQGDSSGVPTSVGSLSLVLDGTDHPHLVYMRTQGGAMSKTKELLYAMKTDNAWTVDTIDSGQSGSSGPYGPASLAVDTNNRPHLMVQTWQSFNYMYWTGSEWAVQTVDGESTSNVSLVLDSANNPHFAYAGLNYGTWTGTDWHTQTVDGQGAVGRFNSLALDTAGRPRISYYDTAGETLKVASWLSDTWHIETVDSTGDGEAGRHVSLALDANGHAHVSYLADVGGDDVLKYARWTGSTWDVQTVDGSGHASSPSLALDANGYPHISYRSESEGRVLKYAHWTGSAWEIQTVDNSDSDDVGLYNSLALDSAGRPHISYFDFYIFALKYAYWTGRTWEITIVDDEGDAGRYTSLALDANDHPHISYQTASPSFDLRYAHWTGNAWDLQTVDSEGFAGIFSSLALDAMGNPHISYRRTWAYLDTPGALKYAHWTGSGWDIQTLVSETDGDVGGSDLALDGYGRAHISYHDGGPNDDLKYAWQLPSLVLTKEAEPGRGLHLGDVLTYTLTISAPGMTASLWDPLPANVDYVAGSLTGTVTPTAVYSPTARAITWQGTVPANSAPVVRFQVTPLITATGSMTLSQPIVNRAWLTDTDHSRSVSASTIVNDHRLYLPGTYRQ